MQQALIKIRLNILPGKQAGQNEHTLAPFWRKAPQTQSLELLWRKGQKSQKKLFSNLIPYNPRLRIFSEKNLDQAMGPIIFYTHAKKLLRSKQLCRKGQKS